MPIMPAPEDVFTIAPPPCFSISGISYFMHRKTPRRSISMIRFPLVFVVVRRRSWLPRLNARVVEGDIEPAESLDGPVQRRLHVLNSRHVTSDSQRAIAVLLDHARRLLVAPLRYNRDDDARSCSSEPQRRRAANPARGAGHECHLSREASRFAPIHLDAPSSFPQKDRPATGSTIDLRSGEMRVEEGLKLLPRNQLHAVV